MGNATPSVLLFPQQPQKLVRLNPRVCDIACTSIDGLMDPTTVLASTTRDDIIHNFSPTMGP